MDTSVESFLNSPCHLLSADLCWHLDNCPAYDPRFSNSLLCPANQKASNDNRYYILRIPVACNNHVNLRQEDQQIQLLLMNQTVTSVRACTSQPFAAPELIVIIVFPLSDFILHEEGKRDLNREHILWLKPSSKPN